jgi:isopentenyldiphosphate isomerase
MQNITKDHEILEVWDWEMGLPTGALIDRVTAHAEGIPHESVHLWILRKNTVDAEILFQHRARSKEIYPDCLDITVGGHVPYGFRGNKILKETDEEIGIRPNKNDLIDLGWYRYEEKGELFFQREFQHVFIVKNNGDLDQYCFKDGEVSGIYAVKINDLKKILEHDIPIDIHGFNGKSHVHKSVSRKDFHPQLFDHSMDVYMQVVLQAGIELMAERRVVTKMTPV